MEEIQLTSLVLPAVINNGALATTDHLITLGLADYMLMPGVATERWSHATDPTNLILVLRPFNQSKGGEGKYCNQLWVGPEFTSIYAEGNLPNAKTIDNKKFTTKP